jgi:putative MFS transporter
MSGTESSSLASRLDALPVRKWHWYLLLLCAAGMGCDQFDTQVTANVLPDLVREWHIDDMQVGLISSSGFFGMLIGAILFGVIADRFGRRKVFMITILWYSLFTGALALTSSFEQLVVMRFIEGLGLGGFVPVGAAYLAEYVPSKKRGQFLAFFTASAMVSYSLSFVVGFLIIVPYGWQWGFALGVLPSLLVVFALRTLPESARYLTKRGKIAEAVEIVEQLEQRILGRITVPHLEAVEAAQVSESVEPGVRYRDLFKGDLAKIVIMLAFLGFAFNFASFSIRMWLPILLTRELHMSLSLGFKLNAIGTLIAVSGQVFAGWTCDHWGRRPSLAYSFLGYAFATYLMFSSTSFPTWAWLCIILYHEMNGAAWGSQFAYYAENFPTRIRATGVAFVQSVARFGALLGPAVVGFLYSRVGFIWVLHLNLALICIAIAGVYLFGRETRLKSLEEINRMNAGGALLPELASANEPGIRND